LTVSLVCFLALGLGVRGRSIETGLGLAAWGVGYVGVRRWETGDGMCGCGLKKILISQIFYREVPRSSRKFPLSS